MRKLPRQCEAYFGSATGVDLFENRKSPGWGFRCQSGLSCSRDAYWLDVAARRMRLANYLPI
jgi:hypothetical protein